VSEIGDQHGQIMFGIEIRARYSPPFSPSMLYWIKGIQNLKQWQSQTAICNAEQRQRTGPDKIPMVRNRIAYAQECLVR